MATGVYSWSQTAASNNASDTAINWSENMAPSVVNDSARAMMSVMAKWRDDWSGVKPSNAVMTTAGSANAQTLSTNGSSTGGLVNGWTLAFQVGAGLANTGATTLQVDGLTTKPLQVVAGTALVGGELVPGKTYQATYEQPLDAWLLRTSPGEFPSTTRTCFNQTAAPVGWTKDTTAAIDNGTIRFVTGTVGSGGSAGFTTAFAARTIAQVNLPNVNLAHSLTCAGTTGSENAAHSHNYVGISGTSGFTEPSDGTTQQVVKAGNITTLPTGNQNQVHAHGFTATATGTVSLGGSGTAMDFAVKYYDFIIAQKN